MINKKINAIITLKRLGFDIIPAFPKSAGKDKYKHPVIKIKDKPALTKNELIDWYTRRPTDLIGIRTNNWFSIDVDTEEHASGVNGYDNFKKYLAPYATTPPAMECLTPTGGMHLYYKKTAGYELKQLSSTLEGVDIQAGVNNYSILYLEPHKKLLVDPNHEASPELLNKIVELQNNGNMKASKQNNKRTKKPSASPNLNGSKFHRLRRTGKVLKEILNPNVDEKHSLSYLNKIAEQLASFGLSRKAIKFLLNITNNLFHLSDVEVNNIISKLNLNNRLNYIGQAIFDLLNPPFGAGERNDELHRTACRLFGYGLESHEVWFYLNLCNDRLSQPLELEELTKLFNSSTTYQVA